MRQLAPGQIYWLNDCPPLDGSEAGRHPVVVVDGANELNSGADPVLVIGITTSDCLDTIACTAQ